MIRDIESLMTLTPPIFQVVRVTRDNGQNFQQIEASNV